MAKFSIAIRKTKKRRNTHKKESMTNHIKQSNKKEQDHYHNYKKS